MIREERLTLSAGDGVTLEACLAAPPGVTHGVVICHPHPLYGGDMDSPVVVRIRDACLTHGLATLRFNFRGVGGSSGTHGGGRGEQEDLRAALSALADTTGARALAVAGYSFGAWVAAVVGGREAGVGGLLLVAPPLAYDFTCLADRRVPALAVGGTEDPYCPAAELERLAARFPWVRLALIDGADHFFFGTLDQLGRAVDAWARRLLAEVAPS